MAVVAGPVQVPAATVGAAGGGRLYLDNYFSVEKARGELGYQPLYTTEQMKECLPYYVDLYRQLETVGHEPTEA